MGWGGASGSPSPPGHHGCASAARVAAGIRITPPSRSASSCLLYSRSHCHRSASISRHAERVAKRAMGWAPAIMGYGWASLTSLGLEKVCFTPSNYHESLVFLPQQRNRVLHLPQLFKPCILPPSSGFEGCFVTETAVATVTIVLFF